MLWLLSVAQVCSKSSNAKRIKRQSDRSRTLGIERDQMKLASVLVLLIAVTGLASYSLVAAQEKQPFIFLDIDSAFHVAPEFYD